MTFGSVINGLGSLPVLGERDIPRRRYSAQTWTRGVASATFTDDTIRGSVDPGPGKSVRREGQTRASEVLWVITNDALFTADQRSASGGRPADRLQITPEDGSGTFWYEVESGEFYETIIPGTKSYKVRRVKESE